MGEGDPDTGVNSSERVTRSLQNICFNKSFN